MGRIKKKEKKWVLELRKEFLHHLGKCSGAGNVVTETNATGCPVRFFSTMSLLH